MRDLKFTKDHVYAEFEESENTENIKSGEPLGVVFGKIAKWISESKEWQTDIADIPCQWWVDDEGTKQGFTAGNENTASGQFSVAIGSYNTASHLYSVAIGEHNTASGEYSVAIGSYNTASNPYSLAVGENNDVGSPYSFAFGRHNYITAGDHCTCIGEYLTAYYDNQTIIGKYNNYDDDCAFSIGNGTDEYNRSNALTVDWDGNAVFAGDVTATMTDGSTISLIDIFNRIGTVEEQLATLVTPEETA